jgi:transmembrane sensor
MIANQATFNTRCIDGTVSVTCIEGMVDVESPPDFIQLRAGQQVMFSVAQGLGAPITADPGAAAWQKGLLIVRDRALAEVVTEVNRYRSGRIVITNADLGRRLVNGTFHLDRLDNFPSQVQQLFGASLRALPGGVVFLS